MQKIGITGLAAVAAMALLGGAATSQVLPPTAIPPPVGVLSASQFAAMKQRAETGEPGAETEFGDLYGGGLAAIDDNGRPAPRDYAIAKIWYQKAADQGYAEAEYNLGMIYLYYDARTDVTRGLTWLRKSADQGYGNAQYALGDMYSEGQGMQKDDVEAYKWYALSASTFDGWMANRTPADMLATLEKEMTADQITQAKALAAAWKPAI